MTQGFTRTDFGGEPVGGIIEWYTSTPPPGWLLCDGSAVSRTTYANLFAKIGTTFGVGDGSTTFNLPNAAGYWIIRFAALGVRPVNLITESSGPTEMTVGAVADGQVFTRSGTTIVGSNPTTGYIYGFPLAYLTTATILVGFPNANGPTSRCRDKADADNISLAAGTTYTVNINTNGGALGNDSFAGPGTAACNNGTTITGTSTTFKTSFGTRTATGTYSSSGTAVTGSGTKFLTEVAVNDLFGDATNGFSRVTAIATDTGLTLSAALPNGNASAGTTGKIIEQPTISITDDGASPHQVATIASDTSLTVTEATTGGSLSGKTYYIGRPYARAAVSAAQYFFVWLGKGASGTTAYVSTQRTTPFGITGYNVSVRRIGVVLLDSSGNLRAFSQFGIGPDRWYTYWYDYSTLKILNNGTATSWTAVAANAWAPPTATMLLLSLQANSNGLLTVRSRNAGGDTTASGLLIYTSAGGSVIGFSTCPCDGAQYIDYLVQGGSNTIYMPGYLERL